MSAATTTSFNRRTKGLVIGLIALGSFVAFVIVVTIAVLGVMLATGTLRHTSQGWAFQAPAGSAASTELRQEKLDNNVDTLLIASGTGSGQTAQFTASRAWRADWTYWCPTNNSSFRVVAQGSSQSYPAGALDNVGSGAGNSNQLPAGTYSFKVSADPGCNWSVGARPNP